MATLSEDQRVALWADYMRELSNRREPCAVMKHELRAAIDAVADSRPVPIEIRERLTDAQAERIAELVGAAQAG